LETIIQVYIPALPSLGREEEDWFALAVVRECPILQQTFHTKLNLNYYPFERMGSRWVYDITCVQCLVGRIKDGNRWILIDRS
ncbi:hypothetical protein DFJ73DRAFT_614309, partial [Zopfochytrium polystomum]